MSAERNVRPFAWSLFTIATMLVILSGIGCGVARAADDSLDLTFNPGTGVDFAVGFIGTQGDRIIIGGSFSSVNGIQRRNLARLNADGSVDAGFDAGTGPRGGNVGALAVRPDGKILVGGGFNSFSGSNRIGVARFNADGSMDNAFIPGLAAGSQIRGIAVQGDGRIVVGGNSSTAPGGVLARLNVDGSLDTTFNPGTVGSVLAVAVQGDGKVIIGGAFSAVGGASRRSIARLNADGSLDAFDPGADGFVSAVALMSDGRVVISGAFTTVGGVSRNGIARLNADGSLDSTFDPGPGPNGLIWTVAVQGGGQVAIGGQFTAVSGVSRNRIARLNANGGLDPGFDAGIDVGGSQYVSSLAIQGDGKIVAGGVFSSFRGVSRRGIARLGTGAFRLDAMIRNASDASYVGDNIYGSSDPLQTTIQSVARGATAVYAVRIENDGTIPGSFQVRGNAGGTGWTVKYFDALSGGNDITARVTATTGPAWPADPLAPGASTVIRVEATPGATVPVGATQHVLVEATALADMTNRDLVKASTIATSAPSAIANTFIADTATHRVIEVTGAGSIVWQYDIATGGGPEQFVDPVHVERLPNGNVLITESYNDRVIEVSRDKTLVWRFGFGTLAAGGCGIDANLCFPQKAVRLANGNTLISDMGHCRVIEVTPARRIVWQYGTTSITGIGPNKLMNPYSAVRLANGNTLIADSGKHFVIEVTPAKRIVWQYGTENVAGSDANRLYEPTSAVRLANGNTLIADLGNNRVIEVATSGRVVWAYGGIAGSKPGQLRIPHDVLRLANGNTLITDTGNQRVIEVTPGGGIVWQYGITGVPSAQTEVTPNTLSSPRNAVRVGVP